jgi:hypothetical protein
MKSNEGKGFHSNGRVLRAYDKWFENNMFPSENGITSFVDITDRKKWNLK